MKKDRLAFEYVPAGEATDDDFNWLSMADNNCPRYAKLPQLQVEHWLRQGKMHLLRFRPGPGVLLVEVTRSSSNVRRLNIVRAAGQGVGWSHRAFAELLLETAREWGCEAVQTMVYSPRIAKALTDVGAKAEAVNMILMVETEDG